MFAQTRTQVSVGRAGGADIQEKAGPKHPAQKASSPTKITDKEQITKNNEKQPVIALEKSLGYKPGTSGRTLRPLRLRLHVNLQVQLPGYADSSIGRRSLLLQNGYVKTYNMQPLQTYQPLQVTRLLPTRPLPITEKILAEIERQGISIS